ncbi:MAG TPA: hypothetical protein VK698_34860 [Kofleriaceae bacterium]|nr:hypothetical protein [Kofleriaceae bacterium]
MWRPRSPSPVWLLAAALTAALVASLATSPTATSAPTRAAPAAPARRAGKVVRVERPRRRAAERVRVCPLTNPDGRRMTCFGGPAPEPGTRFALVDDVGVRGRGVAVRSQPSAQDYCKIGSAHDVELAYDDPRGLDPRPTTGFPFTLAVQGVTLEDGARVMLDQQLRPSGRDLEQVWMAVDRDGDGEPDFAVTAFECSDEVRDLPIAPSGQRVSPYCLDYWLREEAGWTKVERYVFFNCL